MAEGRKSFLERYAGIESGRECERLAPALSAFVDGEADVAYSLALRMHLRHCLACRAAVRGLHDASRPLTGGVPGRRARGRGRGPAEQAHGLFVRVYETVTMHMHERAANSFLRAQAIVDTVTAGEMAAAAAAASAAALAGGGVAVAGVLSAARVTTPQAIIRRADNGMAAAFVKAPAQTHTHAKHRPHSRASTPHLHQKTQSAAAHTVQAAVTTTQRMPPPPASPAPRASAAAASAASSGGGSASSEFGFEGG